IETSIDIIKEFIISEGNNDFDFKNLPISLSEHYAGKNEFIYKTLLLNEVHELFDESILNEVIKNGNMLSYNLELMRNVDEKLFLITGINVDRGFTSKFYYDNHSKINTINNLESNNNYQEMQGYIDIINNFSIEEGIIVHNEVAKELLSDVEEYNVTQYYKSNYNNINGTSSAHLLEPFEGFSYGYVNNKKAPRSNSKILIVRQPAYIPWSSGSLYSSMAKAASRMILKYSENSEYIIKSSARINEEQRNYSAANTNIKFIEKDNLSKFNAYFADFNNYEETDEECVNIENAIKNDTDLIVFQTSKHYNGSDGSLDGLCLVDIIKEYYGIEMVDKRNVYKRSYKINHTTYPYTYKLGDKYEGLIGHYLERSKLLESGHVRWIEYIDLFSKHFDNYKMGENKDKLIEYYELNDKKKYYTLLANIQDYNESFFKSYIDENFELIKGERTIDIIHPSLKGFFFEYSLDFGNTFEATNTNSGILIVNRTFSANQIVVRYNSDMLSFMGLAKNKEVSYSNEIEYVTNLQSRFDVNEPDFVSLDGFYKIYGKNTNGYGADIVIIGDGYLKRDQNLFDEHVQNAIDAFYTYSNLPYHIGAMNFHTVFTISNERGADNVIEIGCSYDKHDNCESIRNDIEIEKDTAIDAVAILNHRIYKVNNGKAFEYIKKYMNYWDGVIAIINSNKYGGVGGVINTTNKNNPHVFIHELGHGFASLQDEYNYGYTTELNPEYCGRNTCSVWEKRDWRHLMDEEITIDDVCKENSEDCPPGTIGWYEGAHTHAKGIWRPTWNSVMSTLGAPFYAYNAEAWAVKTYEKAGGQFSIISPKNEYVATEPGEEVIFEIFPFNEIVKLADGDVRGQEFDWYINDVIQPNLKNKKRIFIGKEFNSGYTVKVVATDVTGLIVREDAKTAEHVWKVNMPQARNSTLRLQSDNLDNYRINIKVTSGRLQVLSKEVIKENISSNEQSPNVYSGYLMKVSTALGNKFYIPVNAAFIHEKGRLNSDVIEHDGLLFDIVITKEMQKGSLSAELFFNGKAVENINPLPLVTVH
ncbi:TPA: hypothetical protein RQK90_004648, partial [Vibrio vulnificus]|nr:hypothetical protein [Vibrio vulnificus]